jgi:predicted amidophosphoribosyltransferase
MFANGLGLSMAKTVNNDFLTRYTASESQTTKTRMERMNVIENMFELEKIEQAQGKHILLVDDVLTTGATLEGCATQLLQIPNVRVSMATIAIAAK